MEKQKQIDCIKFEFRTKLRSEKKKSVQEIEKLKKAQNYWNWKLM